MFDFKIHHFEKVDSTNNVAWQKARQGAEEGLVIVADYQSNGRGKLGKKWESPSGKNLLFSLYLNPPITAKEAPILTQIACRSVGQALKKKYDIETQFKRPNDVMFEGKKLCGILVEASSKANGELEGIVIGVGLNVNSSKGELLPTATSLFEITGRHFVREEILDAILEEIEGATEELLTKVG